MAAVEQLSFLLACIKHTATGGKIDFATVATELNIPTKAAAAKRFERLKKRAQATAFGACTSAVSNANDSDGDNAPAAPKPKRSHVKARGKGKSATAVVASVEDDSGEASASAADTKTAAQSSPNKRKRTPSPPGTDAYDAAFDGQNSNSEEDGCYTSNKFVAVNSVPARTRTPKRAKAAKAAAAIKLEAEAESAKDEVELASATMGATGHGPFIDIPIANFEDACDMDDDAI